MKVQNSNLLMNVAGIDLTETEMESIVGGKVVPWTQMIPKISQGASLIFTNNLSGAVKLLNDTFKGVNWATERTKQQKEFTTFYSKLDMNTKSVLKYVWTQYQNNPGLSGLNTNIKSMLNQGII